MYFKRKAYDKLIEWKLNYAVLLEGARRIGKTTIAKLFAENEYKLYILIDFQLLQLIYYLVLMKYSYSLGLDRPLNIW